MATSTAADQSSAYLRPQRTAIGPVVDGRANNFNVIRLGLAILVLLGHSPELVDGDRSREILTRIFGTVAFGGIAVDGFFLLSGWLIVQSWQRKPVLFDFLTKRILRIYPAFLVATVICAFVVGPLAADPTSYFNRFQWGRFIRNALLLQMPTVPRVFQGTPYPLVNGAMWTIAYEFRCYFLVAILGLCGIVNRRWLWLMLSIITFAAHLVSVPHDYNMMKILQLVVGDPPDFLCFVAFFAAGGCFYLFRDHIRFKASWALIAALLLFACMFRSETAQIGLITLGGYLLFCLAFAPIPWLARARQFPDMSYGLYLYGWPVQKLFIWYFPSISPWVLFPLATLVCLGCGWLSWTFVESWFLQLKRRLVVEPKPAKISGPLVGTSNIVGSG